MKVLVLSAVVPFRRRKIDDICDQVVRGLQAADGVEAEGFRIPFTAHPPERLIDEMSIFRRLRLANVDRLITLTFPAWLVPWSDKVIWLLKGDDCAMDPPCGADERIASAMRTAEIAAFREATHVYADRPSGAAELEQWGGIRSALLRPPLDAAELFTGGDSGDYVLVNGPINAGSRIHLLIEALRHSPDTRLAIAGHADTPDDTDGLRRLIAAESVEDRVTLELRDLAREETARLVNHALAVAYLPTDDRTAGTAVLQALQAGKPVLTTTDAADVLDLVRDGETGWVVSPDAESLGAALAALSDRPAMAARLGRAGREVLTAQEMNWPGTIKRLLA